MTVEEAKTILGRIKIHYPEFSKDKAVQQEWIKELVLYDVDDVNRKLESHMRNEEYGDKLPKLFFLTNHLVPSLEKNRIRHYTVLCPKCGQAIPDTELDNHLQRCIEAHTIIRDMKKYYDIDIDYQELMEMSNEKFEKTYQKYLDKMLEAPIPDFQKRVIMHIKYPEYTDEDINEIIKLMVAK